MATSSSTRRLGATALPVAARAQQGDRVRRIGVLLAQDENDPEYKSRVAAFTQALAALGWTEGRNVRMDLRWGALTSIGCERSRRSWSACNPTSS
jgi:putative ABC transport system substrate-binding protein